MNGGSLSIPEMIIAILFGGSIVLAFMKKNWLFGAAGFGLSVLLMGIFQELSWYEIGEVVPGFVLIVVIVELIRRHKKKKREERAKTYKTRSYYRNYGNSFELAENVVKGKYGEFLVFDELKALQTVGTGTAFLFNVYVPKENNKTTEIDVIIVSTNGLYVIESKNYSGWISGNAQSEEWIQAFQSGREERFYNPIKQNEGHCKYLKEYLGIDRSKIKSYIVFSNRSVFNEIPNNTNDYRIIHTDHLYQSIKEDMETNKGAFTIEEVESIYNKLFPLMHVSEEVKQDHINSIRKE